MHDALEEAKRLVEKIRFSGDKIRAIDTDFLLPTDDGIRIFASTTGLKITADVTPPLYESLSLVCERLSIPIAAVEAYVFASPELQAECYAGGRTECIIRFSSGLVDILEPKEFEFVVGHELGHFMLEHGIMRVKQHQKSLEYFMQQRAQEISVDRVGLIACGSLNTAIKALMKLISGLNGRYVRFDVGAFLAQLHQPSDNSYNASSETTHPSVLIRCRALLWFSLSNYFREGSNTDSGERLGIVDERIQNDLDRHVDGPARARISELKNDLAMWMAVHDIVQRGVFTKREQIEFSNRFGADVASRLLSFLQGLSPSEAQAEVCKRLARAKETLASLLPVSFASEYQNLIIDSNNR